MATDGGEASRGDRWHAKGGPDQKGRREEPLRHASVHSGRAGVNFLGPRRCQQTEGSYVMSLIGGRWRRDQWRGCAMDAILAGF